MDLCFSQQCSVNLAGYFNARCGSVNDVFPESDNRSFDSLQNNFEQISGNRCPKVTNRISQDQGTNN